METLTCDVVVVGAGNAAMSSALAAREKGADVLVLERAPEDERGGNSRFTAGIIRTVFNGVDDLEPLFELNAQDKANSDFGSYTVDKFYDDLGEVTQYRTNPDLAELLVTRSYETVRWLVEKGVKMQPSYGRQAFKVDGKFKFWGGLAVETWGGGPGLIDNLYAAAEREGIKVLYDARATKLIHDDDGIHG
ncbi:MAG: FAD-dependent oxidoreductase, partial [Rhodospirillales bacterium]